MYAQLFFRLANFPKRHFKLAEKSTQIRVTETQDFIDRI